MGSRAVVVVCRDEEAARERFGVTTANSGIVTTRTGRRFFNDPDLERRFLDRVRAALTAADFWGKLETTWACLDCELMPWSAKAQELLRTQYAAVGAAGSASLPRAVAALEQAAGRLERRGAGEARRGRGLVPSPRARTSTGSSPPIGSTAGRWSRSTDLKLAPFHLLATEGRVHVDKDHRWHMETLAEVCRADPELLLATPYRVVDVTDPGEPGGGDRLVGRADRAGRRGDGRQAARRSSTRGGGASPSRP